MKHRNFLLAAVWLLLSVFLLAACDNEEDATPTDTENPNTPEFVLPEDNSIDWTTETVSLTADNFYIRANDKLFTADVAAIDIQGETISEATTILEVAWLENDVEMGVYMAFEIEDGQWQAYEIRFKDGTPESNWIVFEGENFTTPLGQSYSVGAFGRQSNDNEMVMDNLRLEAFLDNAIEG